MSKNAICVWDFTSFDVAYGELSSTILPKFLQGCRKHCKKWGFQFERTKDGQVHCQGRVSFNTKMRYNQVFDLMPFHAHWSPTSKGCTGEKFYDYVNKDRTRCMGPFNDRTHPKPGYIPRQYRDKVFRPFQESIKEICGVFEDRWINLLYCPIGNKGKSVCAHIMRLMHRAIVLPVINDARDIIQSACDQLIGKQLRSVGGVFIDMPRAMNKDRLFGVYSAIEQIKQGWVYDTRYKWREWDFDSPCIWVFTNCVPDAALLSRDRWKYWTIDENYFLKKYVPVDELDFIEDP